MNGMRKFPRVFVAILVLSSGLVASAQHRASDAARADLALRPHSPHNSRIVFDALPSGATRVWINPNEDDTRLYSPSRAQMDADIHISAVVAPSAPIVVSLTFESRGSLQPGPGSGTPVFTVDGRPFPVTAVPAASSRSGPLLFLSTRLDLPLDRFVQLAAAQGVEGRIWDVPFVLLDVQLELLREYAVRLLEAVR